METVEIEIKKNQFLILEEDKAIELAIQEYFNNNIVKINGKEFNIFDYGNYKMKLATQ